MSNQEYEEEPQVVGRTKNEPLQNQSSYRPNYGPYPTIIKEPGIKYLFVTSLVLMILLAIRSLTGLVAIGENLTLVEEAKMDSRIPELNPALLRLTSTSVFSALAVVAAFVSVLILLIISVKGKNKYNPKLQRIKYAKSLKIIAIIATIMCSVYLIVDIMLVSCVRTAFDILNASPVAYAELNSTAMGSMVAEITFIGLLIGCVFQAINFEKFVLTLKE